MLLIPTETTKKSLPFPLTNFTNFTNFTNLQDWFVFCFLFFGTQNQKKRKEQFLIFCYERKNLSMARSIWKGPLVNKHLFRKLKLLALKDFFVLRKEREVATISTIPGLSILPTEKRKRFFFELLIKLDSTFRKDFFDNTFSTFKKKKKLVKRIFDRNSTILPIFVGSTIKIHNGKRFFTDKVVKDMIGKRFGEFGTTRRVVR